jgi:hypothetical protein
MLTGDDSVHGLSRLRNHTHTGKERIPLKKQKQEKQFKLLNDNCFFFFKKKGKSEMNKHQRTLSENKKAENVRLKNFSFFWRPLNSPFLF